MCVVDAGGHVIAAQRMDGAALGAMRLAEGKAYTAVLWGTRTGDFTESTQPGGADWGWNTTDPRIVVYAGGIPLLTDGALVGGLGASGGAADEDEACVVAAAQALGFGLATSTAKPGPAVSVARSRCRRLPPTARRERVRR